MYFRAGTRSRPEDLALTKGALFQLSYTGMDGCCRAVTTRRLTPRAITAPLRAKFRELDSNQRDPVPKTGRDAVNPPRIGAGQRLRTDDLPFTRRALCQLS